MSDATDDQVRPETQPDPTVQPPAAEADPGRPEGVSRGLLLAALVIPAGAGAFTLLWELGFIASIVFWGVAAGAVWLYRVGSNRRVTRSVFRGIVGIVAATLVLSIFAAMFSDSASAMNVPLLAAFTQAQVWSVFADNVTGNPELWQAYLPDILFAVLFAALGCFSTLRRLSREARDER